MSKKIILYDITSKLTPMAWSPNTLKTRFVLNYKGLPFETVYVPYSDIKKLWRDLGLSHIQPQAAGATATLPVISVSSDDGGPPDIIAESFNIALFLDHEFPDTPQVLPIGSRALQASFAHTLTSLVVGPFRPLVFLSQVAYWMTGAQPTFERLAKKWLGTKLEQLSPPGEKRDQAIENMKQSLTTLSDLLNANGREEGGGSDGSGPWVMGSIGPTFGDLSLGAMLYWHRLVGEKEIWAVVETCNGGRWKRHLDRLQQWTTVS